MPIKDEILEELLKDYKNPEDLLGKDGLLKELTKRPARRAATHATANQQRH